MADDFRDLNLGDLFRNWRPSDEERPKRSEGGTGENAPGGTSEVENRAPRALNEKEVRVMGIWGSHDPNNPNGPPKQTFVRLRDNRGRKAHIFIGPFETVAIQMAIEDKSSERPLTHDLLRIVIERLGGKVERVTIDDLWQSTFYARITIALKDNQSVDIDARPSDAIAIALRTRAPIYMAEDVIEVAAQEEE